MDGSLGLPLMLMVMMMISRAGDDEVCHHGKERVTVPKQINFRKSSQGGGGVILTPRNLFCRFLDLYIGL